MEALPDFGGGSPAPHRNGRPPLTCPCAPPRAHRAGCRDRSPGSRARACRQGQARRRQGLVIGLAGVGGLLAIAMAIVAVRSMKPDDDVVAPVAGGGGSGSATIGGPTAEVARTSAPAKPFRPTRRRRQRRPPRRPIPPRPLAPRSRQRPEEPGRAPAPSRHRRRIRVTPASRQRRAATSRPRRARSTSAPTRARSPRVRVPLAARRRARFRRKPSTGSALKAKATAKLVPRWASRVSTRSSPSRAANRAHFARSRASSASSAFTRSTAASARARSCSSSVSRGTRRPESRSGSGTRKREGRARHRATPIDRLVAEVATNEHPRARALPELKQRDRRAPSGRTFAGRRPRAPRPRPPRTSPARDRSLCTGGGDSRTRPRAAGRDDRAARAAKSQSRRHESRAAGAPAQQGRDPRRRAGSPSPSGRRFLEIVPGSSISRSHASKMDFPSDRRTRRVPAALGTGASGSSHFEERRGQRILHGHARKVGHDADQFTGVLRRGDEGSKAAVEAELEALLRGAMSKPTSSSSSEPSFKSLRTSSELRLTAPAIMSPTAVACTSPSTVMNVMVSTSSKARFTHFFVVSTVAALQAKERAPIAAQGPISGTASQLDPLPKSSPAATSRPAR